MNSLKFFSKEILSSFSLAISMFTMGLGKDQAISFHSFLEQSEEQFH